MDALGVFLELVGAVTDERVVPLSQSRAGLTGGPVPEERLVAFEASVRREQWGKIRAIEVDAAGPWEAEEAADRWEEVDGA